MGMDITFQEKHKNSLAQARMDNAEVIDFTIG